MVNDNASRAVIEATNTDSKCYGRLYFRTDFSYDLIRVTVTFDDAVMYENELNLRNELF